MSDEQRNRTAVITNIIKLGLLIAIPFLTAFIITVELIIDVEGEPSGEEISPNLINITHGKASSPLWESDIAYTYDGVQDSRTHFCYVTAYRGGWALLDIPLSNVTHLQILNRQNDKNSAIGVKDIGPPVIGNMTVEICTEMSGRCSLCAVTEEADFGAWSTVQCQGVGIVGNQIRLRQKQDNYLQFCDVKVFGERLIKDVAGPKLEVLAAFGNEPSHLYSSGEVNDLIDGDPETALARCYISNWYYNGLVEFQIELAYVTHVKLLSISDEFYATGMEGIFVSVCTSSDDVNKEDRCEPCGVSRDTSAGAWSEVQCEGGAIKGDRVTITQPRYYLQLCEAQIMGVAIQREKDDATEAPPVKLSILSVTSSYSFLDGLVYPINLYDGVLKTEGWDLCYQVNNYDYEDGQAWIRVNIPRALVREVRLLSGDDFLSSNEMKEVSVEVCESDETCSPCAISGTLPFEEWTTLQCSGGEGITGSLVMLTAPESYFNLCEIEVFGNTLDEK